MGQKRQIRRTQKQRQETQRVAPIQSVDVRAVIQQKCDHLDAVLQHGKIQWRNAVPESKS